MPTRSFNGKGDRNMRILVVAGHPDQCSLTKTIAQTYVTEARNAGHEVALINLASCEFDPVLRYGYHAHMPQEPCISDSQDLLDWCEHVVVIFPVWWACEPSLLKGWFDRVLTPGKAYQYVPGKLAPRRLLRGRTATLIATSHAPSWYAKHNPSYPLARISKHVLGYCGIKVTKRLVLGSVDSPNTTGERIESFLAKVSRAARIKHRLTDHAGTSHTCRRHA